MSILNPLSPPSPIKNGLDISTRLLEISARRDIVFGLIVQLQNELNDLAFEERHLDFKQQQFHADIPESRFKASQEYKNSYIKEVLDL